MKLESGRISPLQLMFSICCVIQSSSMLTSFFLPVTRQDSWLCVLFSMLVALPLYYIYCALAKAYPDKNLIEIFETVFGRVGGMAASLITIWFFVSITTYNLRDIGLFVKQTIMVDTPVVVIMGICILVCAYGIYYGLRVVTRYAMAFSVLAFFILVFSSFLATAKWDFKNLLPMFSQPALHYVQSTNIALTIPFGESVIFLMVTPNVKPAKKGLFRYFIGGMLIGGFTVLNVLIRDIAVLGNIVAMLTLPPFQTLRMVELTRALSRMEIIFAVVLIILLFYKIMMLYYASVLAISQFFKLKSFRPVIPIVGAFCTAYALFIHSSTIEHAVFGQQYAPIIWLFCEYLIPFVTLAVGRLRGRPQEAGLQRGTI